MKFNDGLLDRLLFCSCKTRALYEDEVERNYNDIKDTGMMNLSDVMYDLHIREKVPQRQTKGIPTEPRGRTKMFCPRI
jgi:hypothetical protein